MQKKYQRVAEFFPVISEDSEGELIELDAEKVLSIPRRIRSSEVVRRGFISDFLFQNIAHVFNATADVIEIINQLPAVKESDIQVSVQIAKQKTS